jgi:hypothetical protein
MAGQAARFLFNKSVPMSSLNRARVLFAIKETLRRLRRCHSTATWLTHSW